MCGRTGLTRWSMAPMFVLKVYASLRQSFFHWLTRHLVGGVVDQEINLAEGLTATATISRQCWPSETSPRTRIAFGWPLSLGRVTFRLDSWYALVLGSAGSWDLLA